MVERHVWLGPVDRAYLELAKGVRDGKVQEAEAAFLQAVTLVAQELRVPAESRATVKEYPEGLRFEWVQDDVVQTAGRITGDFKPLSGAERASE